MSPDPKFSQDAGLIFKSAVTSYASFSDIILEASCDFLQGLVGARCGSELMSPVQLGIDAIF